MMEEAINKSKSQGMSNETKQKLMKTKNANRKIIEAAMQVNKSLKDDYEREELKLDSTTYDRSGTSPSDVANYAHKTWDRANQNIPRQMIEDFMSGTISDSQLNEFRVELINSMIEAFLQLEYVYNDPVRIFLSELGGEKGEMILGPALTIDIIFYLNEKLLAESLCDESHYAVTTRFFEKIVKNEKESRNYNCIEKLKKSHPLFKYYFGLKPMGIWTPLYFFQVGLHDEFMRFAFEHRIRLPKQVRSKKGSHIIDANNSMAEAQQLIQIIDSVQSKVEKTCIFYYLDYYYKFVEMARLKYFEEKYYFSDNVLDAIKVNIVDTRGIALRQFYLNTLNSIMQKGDASVLYHNCVEKLIDNKRNELVGVFGMGRNLSSYCNNHDIAIPIFANSLNLDNMLIKLASLSRHILIEVERRYSKTHNMLLKITPENMKAMLNILCRQGKLDYFLDMHTRNYDLKINCDKSTI